MSEHQNHQRNATVPLLLGTCMRCQHRFAYTEKQTMCPKCFPKPAYPAKKIGRQLPTEDDERIRTL